MPDMARLALETTILTHGVPRDAALPLAKELAKICTENGAEPALVGVYRGQPIAGLSDSQLVEILGSTDIPKANSANLGALMHRKSHASTTVAATMEIAASAGIRVFSTGGIGGVHKGFAQHLDISADLIALTRFPVAVVASGVKSILDVLATRELLETLGVPVIGFQTSEFPAFYLRASGASVDARFDDVSDLGAFVGSELRRTGRGMLIANPIPAASELNASQFSKWLSESEHAVGVGATGRNATPSLLGKLHEFSGGKTLQANLELIRSNTALGARLAAYLGATNH
jgi:pseudouridine-5'-phosphate glycosidase